MVELRGLHCVDTIDMDQRAENNPIDLWVRNRHPGLGDGHVFWMPHLMSFAVGYANFKRLEGLPMEQVLNGFHVHIAKYRLARCHRQRFWGGDCRAAAGRVDDQRFERYFSGCASTSYCFDHFSLS